MKFRTYTMEDALEQIIDYRGKTPKKSDSGIPTLSAKSVKNNHIDYSLCYYISPDEYDRFMVRGFPKVGDVLLTTEAPMGMVARLDRDDVGIAQRLLTLRGKQDILDNEYLLYFLQSSIGQSLLKARETGTTVTGIKQAEFRKIQIDIPEIHIQKKIGGILRILDQKIEINNKINENLCDQMKAIYLHAKKSSIWNECKLGEILTFYDHMRKPLSSRQREGMVRLYPYYGATSVVDYVDAYIFDGVYILISEDGANVVDALGHPLIQYTYGKFWVNNHAHIVQGNMFYSEALLFALLKTLNMSSIVTGAAQPKINQANLKDFCIVAPSNQEAMHLSNVLNPFLEQIIKNDLQNTILSNLRDTLLPRLMSGELDISNLDI